MSELKSNRIEKMLKAFYTKIAKRTGRPVSKFSSSTDKFVNYQEHMGKGLTLEIRERDFETSNQDYEVELQKLRIEDRKVEKRLQFAYKAWRITSWVGSIVISVIAILYTFLGK